MFNGHRASGIAALDLPLEFEKKTVLFLRIRVSHESVY
jgi:hypothetical protein